MLKIPVTITPHPPGPGTHGLYLRIPNKNLPADFSSNSHDPTMLTGFVQGTKLIVLCLRSGGIKAYNLERFGTHHLVWTCRARASDDGSAIRVYLPSTDAARLLLKRKPPTSLLADFHSIQVGQQTADLIVMRLSTVNQK